MNFLVWNSRGAGSKVFLHIAKDIVHCHKVDLLVILETHISGSKAYGVISCLGFSGSAKVDVVGFSRGIWVLWRREMLDIEVLSSSSQFINLLVYNKNKPWILTILYANPKDKVRELLWNSLTEINYAYNLPWLVTRI